MTTRTFSHSVSVPPLTDVPEMLGAYGTLFQSLGISFAQQFPFPLSTGFTHPIPEENKKLTNEFFMTSMQLKSAQDMNGPLSFVNASVSSSMVTFIFQYNE